jgi:hypothetical protein
VHMKLVHPDRQLAVEFSERFRGWLVSYWERANLRLSAVGRGSEFVARPGVRA